jgi:polyisoprenoid-binding protein YceI
MQRGAPFRRPCICHPRRYFRIMLTMTNLRSLTLLSIFASASLVAGSRARADDAKPYAIDDKGSEVTYHLVHKLHKVDGTTKKVDGRAVILPDGKVQVEVRVPVATFDSGNVNRDAHMKEVTEAGRFPTLEVKAIGTGIKPPPAGPETQTVPAKAQIEFHGIKQIADIKVEISFAKDGGAKAVTHFPISLDAFKVERPSLMFVKVNDDVVVDARLAFKPAK